MASSYLLTGNGYSKRALAATIPAIESIPVTWQWLVAPHSILSHMRDTNADNPVLFLNGNKSKDDIVFRNELDDITAGSTQRLCIA